jgi:hypothetical protein
MGSSLACPCAPTAGARTTIPATSAIEQIIVSRRTGRRCGLLDTSKVLETRRKASTRQHREVQSTGGDPAQAHPYTLHMLGR